MKNTSAPNVARIFLRALESLLICALTSFVVVETPASAVRVCSIGDNFEQPPGTPKDRPHVIVSGLLPNPDTLSGSRYINLKVVASGSGKPIVNAMAYLVRQPHVEETVVYNTDDQGRTVIWNIEDCYRKLVVTDGVVSVKQWISLPPGCGKDIVVKLPRPEVRVRKRKRKLG